MQIRAALAAPLIAGLLTITSCGGPAGLKKAVVASGVSSAEASFVVDEMIDRAMAAYGVADAATSSGGDADRPDTVTIDEPVHMLRESSFGGQITVTGKVTGTATPAQKVVSLALDATETLTDFKFDASGVTYVVNGAPSVAAAGTIAVHGAGGSPETHLTLKGSFTISRGGTPRTCPVDVDVKSTQAGGGEMKGTLCGEALRRAM
jgi:hypothetical protein